MANATKKPTARGFRQRRSQAPPPPESVEPEESVDQDAEKGGSGADASPPVVQKKTEPSSGSSKVSGSKAALAGSSGGKDGAAGEGGQEKDEGPGETPDSPTSSEGLRRPDEEVVMLGISTSVELWKSYKSLQNHTSLEGRTVKVAQNIRAVLVEALPDSYTDEGQERARKYGEDWGRKRTASSSSRTNRQLYLPASTVRELKRLSMVLEDRGHPTSISAIVSGILDENRPTLANIYKLVNG